MLSVIKPKQYTQSYYCLNGSHDMSTDMFSDIV